MRVERKWVAPLLRRDRFPDGKAPLPWRAAGKRGCGRIKEGQRAKTTTA